MTLKEISKTIGRALTIRKEQPVKAVESTQKMSTDVLGGFFEQHKKSLSNEKTISTKLLEANKGWVYRNNDVIAKEVSDIQFELFQVNLKNGEEDFVEVDDHPILQALDQFNNTTTKSDAIYNTQSHKKLTGDSFWLVDSKGVPGSNYEVSAIYLLPPDKIELKLGDPTTKGDILVKGYEYKDEIDGKKIDITYKPEQIIHFKTPNPKNMFRGYGAVEAAADTIDLDNLTTEVSRKFFENGAISNFVLSTESKITDDQLKRLKAELKGAYGGASKAFQTMILAGGLKPENISYTNKDLEFMTQLEWYRDKIMVLFGNTKASLGIIDDVNRASHDSSIISWKRNSIKPEMEAIVNTLNEFFVPKFGNNLILGFSDPIPEDRDSLLDEIETLVGQNVITINEARQKLGYEEIAGQDELRSTEVPEPLKSIDVKAILRKQGFYGKQKRFKELKESAMPLARKLIKSKHKPKTTEPVRINDSFSEEQITRYWEKKIRIVEVNEKRFENALTQYIGKIVEAGLGNIDDEISKSAKKQLLPEEELLVEATMDFRPILAEVALAAGQQAYAMAGFDEPYLGLNMREQIERNIRNFAESMLETDRELMIDIISEGVQNGKAVPEIRREIQNKFEDYTKTQAERVTRTEVIRVSNQATIDAFIESGVVSGKQWITARDGRVDADCAQYEGKIQYDLRGSFYTGTDKFKDGDPPLHPNCRCDLLPVLDTQRAYTPVSSIEREMLLQKIEILEENVDKRTKAYKEIKRKYREEKADLTAYAKALEQHVGVSDAEEDSEDATDETD